MTEKFTITDYDIIYLSYDEPNAEKNYADLCSKVPWAKRVHGVKGSDAAHKACAELSETDRFITVDGDNIINENFLSQQLDLSEHDDLASCVISWAADNQINGLVYGNGGLKCWPKDYVLRMRTHENADPRNKNAQVDFCWDAKYIQMEGCFSKVFNNATPWQAWRAGFREGVKMCLDRGEKPKDLNEFTRVHWRNLHRLYIWMTVGSDAENGLWAIYGARQGLYKTMLTDWNYINVRDFEHLNEIWQKEVEPVITETNINDKIEELGVELTRSLNLPIPITPLDSESSKFFKTVYQSPARMVNKLLSKEI